MVTAADRFSHYLQDDHTIFKPDGIDIKELCSKFTVDSLAGAIMSIKIDEYGDKKSKFRQMGETIFRSNGILDGLRYMIIHNSPYISKLLGLK